ncbi:MAG TPA: 50S ribosomal protein L11 methyltransferase, partial [Chlamydiales bacterium]|nr:50S ribosomal protein L11 methyltransferase [Chlamydiales bacterium]
GAKKVIGIDICPEALEHAEKNAKVNHLSISFTDAIPTLSSNSLFLMNMIFPEQKAVMKEDFPTPSQWITSGILEEQQDTYLKVTEQWGCKLLEIRKKNGWLGFRFEK